MNRQEQIRSRVLDEANHIICTRATVRRVAKEFGVSKSTVHKDLTERLPDIHWILNLSVREILNQNKSEWHLRGGEATRKKYSIQK